MGYVSLDDLRADMQAAVDAGTSSVSFVLCPETTFDVDDAVVLPALPEVLLNCGGTGCILTGGPMQLRIRGSTIRYEVALGGITIQGFTDTAILVEEPSDLTTFICRECVFQVRDFYSFAPHPPT